MHFKLWAKQDKHLLNSLLNLTSVFTYSETMYKMYNDCTNYVPSIDSLRKTYIVR